uniref:Uncharacterized protein n=1 Tax=Chromera velia CCMP2878 TaxID=1169474 RepID=A0A0G4I1Y6_9ALVE|eukprot:Cvel_34913.t1-p1 / transcript=Cvel_34913.t1 / gene=Cvel_34913 / organism=Chromera_velia_CCMP2878 / gene_product=hypothetical protein / transcript_product=hypothetical protein / location=Cvel_scaffold6168:1465-2757(-) / protein_length=431 / sequence_SO=supercontig / SO=protein_coding / is_pseudo=false
MQQPGSSSAAAIGFQLPAGHAPSAGFGMMRSAPVIEMSEAERASLGLGKERDLISLLLWPDHPTYVYKPVLDFIQEGYKPPSLPPCIYSLVRHCFDELKHLVPLIRNEPTPPRGSEETDLVFVQWDPKEIGEALKGLYKCLQKTHKSMLQLLPKSVRESQEKSEQVSSALCELFERAQEKVDTTKYDARLEEWKAQQQQAQDCVSVLFKELKELVGVPGVPASRKAEFLAASVTHLSFLLWQKDSAVFIAKAQQTIVKRRKERNQQKSQNELLKQAMPQTLEEMRSFVYRIVDSKVDRRLRSPNQQHEPSISFSSRSLAHSSACLKKRILKNRDESQQQAPRRKNSGGHGEGKPKRQRGRLQQQQQSGGNSRHQSESVVSSCSADASVRSISSSHRSSHRFNPKPNNRDYDNHSSHSSSSSQKRVRFDNNF